MCPYKYDLVTLDVDGGRFDAVAEIAAAVADADVENEGVAADAGCEWIAEDFGEDIDFDGAGDVFDAAFLGNVGHGIVLGIDDVEAAVGDEKIGDGVAAACFAEIAVAVFEL